MGTDIPAVCQVVAPFCGHEIGGRGVIIAIVLVKNTLDAILPSELIAAGNHPVQVRIVNQFAGTVRGTDTADGVLNPARLPQQCIRVYARAQGQIKTQVELVCVVLSA